VLYIKSIEAKINGSYFEDFHQEYVATFDEYSIYYELTTQLSFSSAVFNLSPILIFSLTFRYLDLLDTAVLFIFFVSSSNFIPSLSETRSNSDKVLNPPATINVPKNYH
jgi:hypothetical protein